MIVAALWAATGDALGETVDYGRQIRPILSEHCLHCHGADPATRQGGLRLDVREQALAGGDSGRPALTPGDPAASLLWQRAGSHAPDEAMPPPEEGKPLSAAQVDLLAAWIRQGAPYAPHWSFVPPAKAPLPAGGSSHPIDAFVERRLRDQGRGLAPRAADDMLCRRLYLDLIGLPPSPAEVDRFRREGYAATVDALLASERFGEKQAQAWLDVARYSDTNGYEKDLRREQWAWRDWVVRAFNRDMPYDQFVIEQIAGDLLPEGGQDERIATGMLRNSMINEEGAIIAEEFRMAEMFDRMDCLGKAVLGLTIQCAQCHNHKFDPLAQSEYYGVMAFLNNAYEARSSVYAPEQLEAIAAIGRELRALDEQVLAARPDWQREFAAWQEQLVARRVAWRPLEATELGSAGGLNHPVQLGDRSLLLLGHWSDDIFLVAQPRLQGVTGMRLELLTHGDLPQGGPGRSPTGEWSVRELAAWRRDDPSAPWQPLALKQATADFAEPEQKSDDGKQVRGPVALLIDGANETFWEGDRGNGRRNQPASAVVQFAEPCDFPATAELKVVLRMDGGRMPGCCRISLTDAADPRASDVPHAAVLAASRPAAERTAADQEALRAAWLATRPERAALEPQREALWARYPEATTSVLHLAEPLPAHARMTHVLQRGEWNKPGAAASPGTPAALHPFAAERPANRLEFARWLVSERSPLAARVAVNRTWLVLFGEGLLSTPDDFGMRSPAPEYQEVLDWLAADFMERNWSHKQLLRTIVTSAVYQQSSAASAAEYAADPRNRRLARGPRFRPDAETVRDIALTAAGLMHHQTGGPPVIPPVPQTVLDYNFEYPEYWKVASGPERYRRSLYVFRKRSMPDPVLSSLDAPTGDAACAFRPRSNSPLAALTLLNEPVFVEASRALALRILREAGGDDAERAAYGFRLCTGRAPDPDESATVLALLESRRARLAEGWLNPRAISTGDHEALPELPTNASPQDAAAWTLVARVLLNLDETITKN